jgi:hypothetical protein
MRYQLRRGDLTLLPIIKEVHPGELEKGDEWPRAPRPAQLEKIKELYNILNPGKTPPTVTTFGEAGRLIKRLELEIKKRKGEKSK